MLDPAERPLPTSAPAWRIASGVYPRRRVAPNGHRRRLGGVCLITSVGFLVAGTSGVLAMSGGPATVDAAAQRVSRTFPGGPYFNVACGFSHRNNDDPIVFPGEPGRSHNHTFIGNREVDASTTPESLEDGSSTCGELDSSTYWVPTLFEGIEPADTARGDRLLHPPHLRPGRLDPGRAQDGGRDRVCAAAAAEGDRRVELWRGRREALPGRARVPESSALVFNLRFPNCWNGKTTDSPDHKRHMAYSTGGACPASHPVRLPTIQLVLIYAPTSRYAVPASGKWGAHGDFMNGWDRDVLARLVSGLNY